MEFEPAVRKFELAYVERARAALANAPAVAGILPDRRVPESSRDGSLLAGWWCREGTPGLVVLPNPWDDRDAIVTYAEHCSRLTDTLIGTLAQALNQTHGVDQPDEYWELLMAPWLQVAVAVVVDRALFCATARELLPETPVVGAAGALAIPLTMEDAVSHFRSDAWNAALIALLAGPPRVTGPPAPEAPPRRTPGRPPAPIRLIPAAAVRVLLGSTWRRRVALVGQLNLSPGQTVRLAASVRGLRLAPSLLRGRGPEWAQGFGEAPAHQARPGLAELAVDGDNGATVAGLLPSLLPRSLLEGYGHLVATSRRRFGPPSNVMHGNYAFVDLETEFLARCRRAERRLGFAQHGGAALQLRAAPGERHEQREGAPRLIWGRAPGAVVTPNPYVQRLFDGHRGGDRVVLVEALTPPDTYLLRFSTVPLANQSHREIERLAEFAAGVTSAKHALVLKRFPGSGEAARPSELERLPVPHTLARRPAVEWMRSARVAVVAYPDTPFIQAMVLGAPTLGLWDTELWEMRPDAAVHFERLAQLGVIYRDPLAAAAKLDEIYERADEWWASGEIQAARTAFLERFAVRGDWLPAWTRVLRELARG
jgi:hypothetical protein